jgi:hypothetical protein
MQASSRKAKPAPVTLHRSMRLFLSDLDSGFLMTEKVHAVRPANRIAI